MRIFFDTYGLVVDDPVSSQVLNVMKHCAGAPFTYCTFCFIVLTARLVVQILLTYIQVIFHINRVLKYRHYKDPVV